MPHPGAHFVAARARMNFIAQAEGWKDHARHAVDGVAHVGRALHVTQNRGHGERAHDLFAVHLTGGRDADGEGAGHKALVVSGHRVLNQHRQPVAGGRQPGGQGQRPAVGGLHAAHNHKG